MTGNRYTLFYKEGMSFHRVINPFIALEPTGGQFRTVTLEPGDDIVVQADRTTVRNGLVQVVYEGLVLSAFLRDIEDRTQEMSSV